MNKEKLKKVYNENIEKINNADEWLKKNRSSEESKILLDLVKDIYKFHYKMFLEGEN